MYDRSQDRKLNPEIPTIHKHSSVSNTHTHCHTHTVTHTPQELNHLILVTDTNLSSVSFYMVTTPEVPHRHQTKELHIYRYIIIIIYYCANAGLFQ